MRKKIDPLLFSLARTGLILTMIVCLLSATAAIVMVSFNLTGRIWLNENKTRSISLSDFDRGIPFHAKLVVEIPDSSILIAHGRSRSLFNYYAKDHAPKQVSMDRADYSDKIFSDFNMLNGRGDTRDDIRLSGAKLKSAVFYLQPGNFWDRLLLSLPGILPLLLFAFCSWQLFKLVGAINSGSSFNTSSPTRIARIGWAVFCTVLVLFILDLLPFSVNTVLLNFSSSIPNFRMPFEATAYKESYFRLDWLIGSAIILLVAKAFRYGHQLQKHEDLTI